MEPQISSLDGGSLSLPVLEAASPRARQGPSSSRRGPDSQLAEATLQGVLVAFPLCARSLFVFL